jgi:hypothetical protein
MHGRATLQLHLQLLLLCCQQCRHPVDVPLMLLLPVLGLQPVHL